MLDDQDIIHFSHFSHPALDRHGAVMLAAPSGLRLGRAEPLLKRAAEHSR